MSEEINNFNSFKAFRIWRVLSAVLFILIILLIFFRDKEIRIVDKNNNIEKIDSSGNDNNFTNTDGGVKGLKTDEKENSLLVTKVIDGDTIVLENGKIVRYIGIDTPEVSLGKVCFSQEATDKNKQLVLGKKVELNKDVSETDRYGRLLRYVYEGGNFINEILVREGYANALTYPPDTANSDLFMQAQKEAREEKRGLWGMCKNDINKSSSNRNRYFTRS